MTIYLGDGIGDDPPKQDRDKIYTDDDYMAIGGQLHYIGTPVKQNIPNPSPFNAVKDVKHNPDDDWIWFDTYCVYVGK